MARKKRQPETVSGQLADFIRQSDRTMYRISKMAGMNQSQLCRFLATGRGISTETLDRLCSALRLRLVQDADE